MIGMRMRRQDDRDEDEETDQEETSAERHAEDERSSEVRVLHHAHVRRLQRVQHRQRLQQPTTALDTMLPSNPSTWHVMFLILEKMESSKNFQILYYLAAYNCI